MVLVFKTSLRFQAEVAVLAPGLDLLLRKRGSWNVDLEDSDAILRIETHATGLQPDEVIRLLLGRGFLCQELMDEVPGPAAGSGLTLDRQSAHDFRSGLPLA